MRERMSQPTKGRLKRGSFIHRSRILERKHQDILGADPIEIPQVLENPVWNEEIRPLIKFNVPGVGQKDSQSNAEKKSYTMELINNSYPLSNWTHVYTDGSAEEAVKNGGAGIYINYPGGEQERISLAINNYWQIFHQLQG